MTYGKNEYNRGRCDCRIANIMSLGQGARKKAQERCNCDPASQSLYETQEPTRGRHALKYVGVQFVSHRQGLNRDEKRA